MGWARIAGGMRGVISFSLHNRMRQEPFHWFLSVIPHLQEQSEHTLNKEKLTQEMQEEA